MPRITVGALLKGTRDVPGIGIDLRLNDCVRHSEGRLEGGFVLRNAVKWGIKDNCRASMVFRNRARNTS